MSTDYNYDDQVRDMEDFESSKSILISRKPGPILPLFHLYHLRTCHPPPIVLPPQAHRWLVIFPEHRLLLKADSTSEIENTAPRIHSDFKPPDDDLIQGQKRKQWRRERRLKRIITAGLGYLTMALMLYLITVTKTSAPKIWDPYDILGISMVGKPQLEESRDG